MNGAAATRRQPEQITFAPNFAAWQKVARRALANNLAPENTIWEELDSDQPALAMFDEHEEHDAPDMRFRVPNSFVGSAMRVACHRDPKRWALLYRLVWRLTHGEPRLFEIVVDPDVNVFMRMDKAVRHEVHKMRAFVRFRAIEHNGATWHVAWFQPEHRIVELNAPFFRDRFANMRWSILTPERCVHWDGKHLTYTKGVPKSEAPGEDTTEKLWRTYYANIFNPARVKTKAMQKEMPKRYWKNLPETEIIPALLEEAPTRVEKMLRESHARVVRDSDYSLAQPPLTNEWQTLRESACACQACPLWKNATQTVFGEGPRDAEIMLLGEQPGDVEDRGGRVFIGPAGQLLDQALNEAGIDRTKVYVTNAVKHFKWESRGKRRIHQTPNSRDIAACRPWLEAELHLIKPRMLVCLGSTAATTIFGAGVRVLRDRGQVRESKFAAKTMITFHPSALLRASDEATHAKQFAQFVSDLRVALNCIKNHLGNPRLKHEPAFD
ncbi:MAG TPA: UdgX family uracil-DNA binding protein [Candidatus Udaeobacter sp.]|jgi:DNA polymerase|nr:UdgX family uracil-DNA binding protein [Candidatus Udaeobacter sp.]